jgi:hypothetical protein
MAAQYSTRDRSARSPSRTPGTYPCAVRRHVPRATMRSAALFAMFALVSPLVVPPPGASAAPFGLGPFAPGSVVVAQGGTISGNDTGVAGTVQADGYVNVYPPDANGDVAPRASFINGMDGPFVAVFDPSGDLWAANVDGLGTLVEFTRSALGTYNPVPAVTISGAGDALEYPYGMAFDSSGDLWVVAAYLGRVYEYTKSQLTSTGSPLPNKTFTNFPGTPGGDGFDPSGDLWVTTAISTDCPQGCVVEFPKDELAASYPDPDPDPTVIISSTGGANLSFTPSGDMWLVTGGGPQSDCIYGDPCNNELVEFTNAQLSTSGSPAPAVTIKSDLPGCSTYGAPSFCALGSLYGPYGVAVDAAGDAWVSNFNTPTAVEYASYQLSRSGSPIPRRTIAGPRTGMNWPSFVVTVP